METEKEIFEKYGREMYELMEATSDFLLSGYDLGANDVARIKKIFLEYRKRFTEKMSPFKMKDEVWVFFPPAGGIAKGEVEEASFFDGKWSYDIGNDEGTTGAGFSWPITEVFHTREELVKHYADFFNNDKSS